MKRIKKIREHDVAALMDAMRLLDGIDIEDHFEDSELENAEYKELEHLIERAYGDLDFIYYTLNKKLHDGN